MNIDVEALPLEEQAKYFEACCRLRIMTHEQGVDVSKLLSVLPDGKLRRALKGANFSAAYGQKPRRVAEQLRETSVLMQEDEIKNLSPAGLRHLEIWNLISKHTP